MEFELETRDLDLDLYNELPDWNKKFKNYKVNFDMIEYDKSWNDMFSKIKKFEKYKILIDYIVKELKDNKEIYPYPDLLFNCFKLTPLDKVRVVILGQDPYPGFYKEDGKEIPHAMGLSFSVATNIKIPVSLLNIFKNLKKFKCITSINKNSGNLESWADQGVLLLNTSLTVVKNSKLSHYDKWSWMTNFMIEYISKKLDKIVFVLWGNKALEKLNLIDMDKHEVIITSHPSGQSCNKSLKTYKSFMDTDIFNDINKMIKGKKIKWKI